MLTLHKEFFHAVRSEKKAQFHEPQQARDRLWQIVCSTQMEQTGSLR